MPNYNYETLAELGREATAGILRAIWKLGWYALYLPTTYGNGDMHAFAKDTGLARSTLYSYRAVVDFWTSVDYEKFHDIDFLLEEYPMLRWGHYKAIAAHYQRNNTAAFAMLEIAASEGYTVDELVQKLTSAKTGESWTNAAQGDALILAIVQNRVTLSLEDCDIEKLRLAQKRGESVRIKIMVQGEEVNA